MAMAWSSDLQGRCLKHLERRPSPGVCSVCLNERLVHLSNCKSSSYSSASLSTSYSPSSSESSTRSTFPLPAASSWAPPHEEGEEHEQESSPPPMSKEATRLSGRAGRLWPLRRSRSAAYEVKRPATAEKTKRADGGGAGGGGLWSMLMMKVRKEGAEEKGKGRRWRFGQSKTVKDISFLGVS